MKTWAIDTASLPLKYTDLGEHYIYLGVFYSYVNKASGLFLRYITIRHAFEINI